MTRIKYKSKLKKLSKFNLQQNIIDVNMLKKTISKYIDINI